MFFSLWREGRTPYLLVHACPSVCLWRFPGGWQPALPGSPLRNNGNRVIPLIYWVRHQDTTRVSVISDYIIIVYASGGPKLLQRGFATYTRTEKLQTHRDGAIYKTNGTLKPIVTHPVQCDILYENSFLQTLKQFTFIPVLILSGCVSI